MYFVCLLIILLKLLNSEGSVIYFGNCPIVIGGKCDSSQVKFYLYSKNNPTDAVYVYFNEDGKDNLTSSPYDPTLANKLIIHGYNADMHLGVLQTLKNEYLESKNFNIWMVDYAKLVVSPCYLFSVYNIKYVGRCIASFITRLNSTVSKHQPDMHVIGFSLGGQVPNYVAQYLPFKLQRITGLDPALPLFYTSILGRKLDPSDAVLVDVIHTNALVQGQIMPCGHIDFYLNGGMVQPGCPQNDKFNCYHTRAVEYFTESINSQVGFWGWNCDSFLHFIEGECKPSMPLVMMGEHVTEGVSGIYLLNTADKSPFAKGNTTEDVFNGNESSIYDEFIAMTHNNNWTSFNDYTVSALHN